MKALSFLDGNLNYKEAQQSSLEAHISIEEQVQAGRNIAFGETIVFPFHTRCLLPSNRESIEIYIDKINNNIKPGQYLLGDTILLIDIKQLLLRSKWDQSGIAFYQEGLLKSIASGVLWNTAFGHAGEMIYQLIEFEGKQNTDNPFEKTAFWLLATISRAWYLLHAKILRIGNTLGFPVMMKRIRKCGRGYKTTELKWGKTEIIIQYDRR